MIALSGVQCNGNEDSLNQCLHDIVKEISCPGPIPDGNIAGVTCVNSKIFKTTYCRRIAYTYSYNRRIDHIYMVDV